MLIGPYKSLTNSLLRSGLELNNSLERKDAQKSLVLASSRGLQAFIRV